MNASPTPNTQKNVNDTLKSNPSDWENRKDFAKHLYDKGSYQDAADVVWATDGIPGSALDLAFAAKVLAKASPGRAIRLLTEVLEHNRGKAPQILAFANALLHQGMVLQAARFYGAALEADPSIGNAELEHFVLWTDDEETLWGEHKDTPPKLGVLPWMKDPAEALKLTTTINLHTTPIMLPGLPPLVVEEAKPAAVTPTLAAPTRAAVPSPTVTAPPRPVATQPAPIAAGPPAPPTVRLKPALPPIKPKSA